MRPTTQFGATLIKHLGVLLAGIFVATVAYAADPPVSPSLPGCYYTATPSTLSDGSIGYILCDSGHKLVTSSGGNVVGPASSTDNAIPLWDGTTGKLLKDQGAILTANTPNLINQTWNNAGITFTTLKINVTPTAAAAASAIMDLQYAGISQYLFTGLTSGANARLNFASDGNGALIRHANNQVISFGPSSGSILYGGFQVGGIYIGGALGVGAQLFQDGSADILAQRRGLNAQTFNLYKTYTDASNYERLFVGVNGNNLVLDAQAAGTGTLRSLVLRTNGNDTLTIQSNNNLLIVGGAYLKWQSAAAITSPSDGIFTISNNAANDFTRLQFGGTTSSFPSLKRNATIIDIRLADDSNYAPLAADTLRTAIGYTVAGLPAAGQAGRRSYVTDQLTTCAAIGVAPTGGGAVKCPVFDNGAAWVGG